MARELDGFGRGASLRPSFVDKTVAGTLMKVGEVSIGRHYLIPDAFLPYRNESAPQGLLPGLDASNASGLRTIATVHSALSYAIALVGEEALPGCGPVAHLSLRPLNDSPRYNVRDMWVRRSDLRLCKAVFATRLFQPVGTAISYPAIVTTVLDANGMIASFSLVIQTHSLLGSYAVTDDGTFAGISWTDERPSYLFDYTSWKASGGIYQPRP